MRFELRIRGDVMPLAMRQARRTETDVPGILFARKCKHAAILLCTPPPLPYTWQLSCAASKAVFSRMQLDHHATRRTPHASLRARGQAMSAWSVKTRRASSRHCRDAFVYGHTRLRPCMISSTPSPPSFGLPSCRHSSTGTSLRPPCRSQFGMRLKTTLSTTLREL